MSDGMHVCGGYWSVEDGRPYWVDDETHAHLSPVSLEPRHPAWSALAEIIAELPIQSGGSCPVCDGEGSWEREDGGTADFDCPNCNGTGQLDTRANMGVHIPIDPNVRVEHGWTYARLGVGQAVTVYESESGIEGPAIVERIDPDKGFVYLSVKWDQLDGTADMGGVSAEGTEQ